MVKVSLKPTEELVVHEYQESVLDDSAGRRRTPMRVVAGPAKWPTPGK